MLKRRHLTSELLEPRHLLAAQLVEDINPQRYGEVFPGPMVEVGGVAYFSAHSDGFGEELWRTDGTPAGTVLLKDIHPGTGSSDVQNLVNVNGLLYFTANDGERGNELWKSDGTATGTVLVRELVPGATGVEVGLATAVNSTLFFKAIIPSVGWQLWKSDGTPDGTQLVASAAGSDNRFPIADMVNVSGTLYFSADMSQDGTELWRTDGTPVGTTLVKDINPGSRDSVPYSLYNWNGKLIFNASAPVVGRELWISDGTSAGTKLIADLNLSDNDAYPQRFKSFGRQLFFVTEQGERLWVTDGTAQGTKLLLQVPPNTGLIASMLELSGKIYFGFGNYDKLWSSDGTVAGTGPVTDPSFGNLGVHPAAVNNNVLYLLGNDARGPELWSYIPTSSTLQFLGDIVPGGNGSYPRNFTIVHNQLTFFAGVHELWTSMGTPGTTQLVSSALNQTASSNPRNLINGQGVLYFSANESTYGSELWRSDGTAAGTYLLKGTSFYPSVTRGVDEWVPFVAIGRTLFFSSEFTLWRSDGTSAGTISLGNSRFRNIRDLTVVRDKVYFVADDDQHGGALWVSDGTIAGTRSLTTELIPGHAIINARLLNLNDELVFRRITPQAVEEWWKSDGTRPGTSFLIRPSRYNIFDMFTLDGRTLFTQGNEVIGLDFWRFNSNGQPERVNTFCPGAPFETNQGVVIGTKYYYISMTACNFGKFGVWELEGTRNRLIAEVDEPVGLTNVNGTLFFAAGTAGQKRIMTFSANSLTVAGTLPAKRLSNFTSAAGMLVFKAHTASGEELWMSDGKSVQQLDDIIPGSGGSDPQSPTVVGTNLFFSGWGEGIGRELWKLDIDRPPTSLTFTGAPINESAAIDTSIGTFDAIDPNGATQLKYSLAVGGGDDDNARFTIDGNALRLASRLEFEAD
ncbi:MAG: hypothetical protein IT423_10030, partial [Pirellulaceae bacterium]|nr:hypothetical protein [Pirellulaceae bacterium]